MLDALSLLVESPCANAQGIIPAAPGYTVLGQLSAKPHLASHVARTIPCGHRGHTPPQGGTEVPVLTHGVLFRDKIRKALGRFRKAGREMKQQFYFTPVCSLEE